MKPNEYIKQYGSIIIIETYQFYLFPVLDMKHKRSNQLPSIL